MPTLTYDTKEAIPAGLESSAKEVDGKFSVNVVEATKLEEFRTNNHSLRDERDSLKTASDAFSTLLGKKSMTEFSTEINSLRETHQQVADGKLKKSDDINAEVSKRFEEKGRQYETQLAEAGTELSDTKAELTEYKTRYNRSVVEREVTAAILSDDSGVNPAAIGDILSRAYSLFEVSAEGKIVAMNNGVVVYGTDGINSMTPSEWLAKVLKEAPYLGLASSGGGAAGSEGDKIGGMSSDTFNKLSPTDRMQRFRNSAK